MANPSLEDNKFSEKQYNKAGFLNDNFQKDREILMLKEERNLTLLNKKLIGKIREVHKHLKNIVDNTKQHCDFCKIMNLTQKKWEKKKFESSIESET